MPVKVDGVWEEREQILLRWHCFFSIMYMSDRIMDRW
jgi:hypothetical protein